MQQWILKMLEPLLVQIPSEKAQYIVILSAWITVILVELLCTGLIYLYVSHIVSNWCRKRKKIKVRELQLIRKQRDEGEKSKFINTLHSKKTIQ